MIRRPTWILLLLFLATLAAAWLWQRSEEKKSETEPTLTPVARLLEMDANTIREIKIEDNQKNHLFLKRVVGDIWIMTEPERQDMDAGELASKVNQLGTLNILSTLQNPPEASQVGLLPPAYTLIVIGEDGKEYILDVGSETPTQTGRYVRLKGLINVVSSQSIESIVGLLANPPIAPVTETPAGEVAPLEVITGTVVKPAPP